MMGNRGDVESMEVGQEGFKSARLRRKKKTATIRARSGQRTSNGQSGVRDGGPGIQPTICDSVTNGLGVQVHDRGAVM